jgi:hypothetical protein
LEPFISVGFFFIVISIIIYVLYKLSLISHQIKLIMNHFNIKDPQEMVWSDEEIENELEQKQ